MSADFLARIFGLVILSIAGVYWGVQIGSQLSPREPQLYAVISGLVGALIGLILTPYVTTRPILSLRAKLHQISSQKLVAGLFGLLSGLIVAALLTSPLSQLPQPMGEFLPSLSVLLFGYLGVALFVMRAADIFSVLNQHLPGRTIEDTQPFHSARPILLDTSVIIDGRIADIAKTGFLIGTLLIPRFVLNELQYIADSADNLRRQRGRRGLEILSDLQKNSYIPVKMTDMDPENAREVDDKLVILARQLRCPILTNDYNLNRVAELQGIKILNINELANAVKSVLLPGETLRIKVIQEGKELGQGVGYLEDGTMVVVEDGRSVLNRDVAVNVTKVLQTAAGRMIFARIEEKP
ncbi:MAG: PIN/TRAM domain-containing protein [Anaerolineales bacterium]